VTGIVEIYRHRALPSSREDGYDGIVAKGASEMNNYCVAYAKNYFLFYITTGKIGKVGRRKLKNYMVKHIKLLSISNIFLFI